MNVRRHPVAAAAALLVASVVAGCGGGGGSDGFGALDAASAQAQAADAVQVHSDAATVADSGVAAATAMVSAGAGTASSSDRATAQSVQIQAGSPRACPGGGTATVTITGGTDASRGNGRFDTGEVYTVVYAGCSGAAGVARLDGTLAITVQSASGDDDNGAVSLAITSTALTLALPRGDATLDGSSMRAYTVATDGDGTKHLTSHFTTSGMTLVTHYNARTATFRLSDADIARTATVVGGVVQATTIQGHHTIDATLPSASFEYSVATTGTATYDANGNPVSGTWTLDRPRRTIVVVVANGQATITVDEDKDGTIDRTIVVSVPQLVASAG